MMLLPKIRGDQDDVFAVGYGNQRQVRGWPLFAPMVVTVTTGNPANALVNE